ncbi:hypothetical protein ABE438_03650 [Bosea sp. TWI1241]|uniref:hypothetical protein n=1 Tax=Bosea sp. TWI1241 TaxID=3148904 RepID=UPI00320B96E1
MGLFVPRTQPVARRPSRLSVTFALTAFAAITVGAGQGLVQHLSERAAAELPEIVGGKIVARHAAAPSSAAMHGLLQPASVIMPLNAGWPETASWRERDEAPAAPVAARRKGDPGLVRVSEPMRVSAPVRVRVQEARALPAIQAVALAPPLEIAPLAQADAAMREDGFWQRTASLARLPVDATLRLASGTADGLVSAGRWTAGLAGGLLSGL